MSMKNEDVKTIAKLISQLAIEYGCTVSISNLVSMVTPANVGLITKVCMKLGGTLMGSAVGDMTAKYTFGTIEKAINAYYKGGLVNVLTI